MPTINQELIVTGDGSHSIYRPDLKETYHSTQGAIGESQHVFINNGLRFYCDQLAKSEINIFEVGFGTGLNALLSAQESSQLGKKINYLSIEPYPLPNRIVASLNYPEQIAALGDLLPREVFDAIHSVAWEEWQQISNLFILKKMEKTLEDLDETEVDVRFDVVYYDAFAPRKQPEIWNNSNLSKVYRLLNPSGMLVTYCAQGQFKRDLASLGFVVESLEGPPGKYEMVRATKS